jgi:ribosomal protein L40E
VPDITCPECGQVSEFTAIRRAHDEFCSHCDYPLFWAPSSVPVVSGGPATDTTLRRLPGAGGRMLIGTQVCPSCGELNPIAETHCIRCHSDLHPKPPEPPPPPPPPPPEPIPEPVLVEESRWRWWLLLLILFVIVTVVVIVVAQ